jgi:hypothetical protein
VPLKPSGSVGVGTGGSVGSDGVLLDSGVEVAGNEGGGVTVGETVVGGGAVGAAVAGADGGDVRVPGVADGVAEAAEAGVAGDVGPPVGDASGELVAVFGESAGGCGLPASGVALNPARASPTASDGPRRTYKVKDARPLRPEALSPGLPSSPPTLGRYFLPCCESG